MNTLIVISSRRRQRATVLTRRLALPAFLSALLVAPASSQWVPVDDPLFDYLRVLEISGQSGRKPSFFRVGAPADSATATGHPWGARIRLGEPLGPADDGLRVHPTGARLRVFANARHPFGWNDGAAWQGRGVSVAGDAGVGLRWRGLSVRIHPELVWMQNASYEIAPAAWPDLPDFAYPWRYIDLPQRPGEGSHSALTAGDSEIRLDAGAVTVGVSHRSRWWGPGVRNAILMSNNASGFPHAFIGTRDPVDVGFATLEAFYLYGGLRQSDWFDEALEGNGRFLAGWVVGASPAWPAGLSLGGARIVYGLVPESGHSVSDVLSPFSGFRKKSLVTPDNPPGDDENDQLIALFMRWVLPESGFEVYAEWSRTDHAWDFRDFILEPEHAQGRTLGLRHASHLGLDRLLVLALEFTDLSKTTTSRVRDNPTYYEHRIVKQGYTHRGQVLGAGVGPGGSAQSVTIDLFDRWGRAGLVLERRVRDNDAYYFYAQESGAEWCCHDVSFSAGPRALLLRGDFEFGVDATVTRELNRYFRRGNDVWNLNVGLSARWRGH